MKIPPQTAIPSLARSKSDRLLGELGAAALASIPRLERPLSEIAHFTAYSVEFRYPGDSPEPTLAECHEAIQGATVFDNLIRDEIKTLQQAADV